MTSTEPPGANSGHAAGTVSTGCELRRITRGFSCRDGYLGKQAFDLGDVHRSDAFAEGSRRAGRNREPQRFGFLPPGRARMQETREQRIARPDRIDDLDSWCGGAYHGRAE